MTLACAHCSVKHVCLICKVHIQCHELAMHLMLKYTNNAHFQDFIGRLASLQDAINYEHWGPTSVRQAASAFNTVLLTMAVARLMQLCSTSLFLVCPTKQHHDHVCHLQLFKAHANNKGGASEWLSCLHCSCQYELQTTCTAMLTIQHRQNSA